MSFDLSSIKGYEVISGLLSVFRPLLSCDVAKHTWWEECAKFWYSFSCCHCWIQNLLFPKQVQDKCNKDHRYDVYPSKRHDKMCDCECNKNEVLLRNNGEDKIDGLVRICEHRLDYFTDENREKSGVFAEQICSLGRTDSGCKYQANSVAQKLKAHILKQIARG